MNTIKFLIIMALFLCSYYANSQVRDPYQQKFYWNDSIYLNNNNFLPKFNYQ